MEQTPRHPPQPMGLEYARGLPCNPGRPARLVVVGVVAVVFGLLSVLGNVMTIQRAARDVAGTRRARAHVGHAVSPAAGRADGVRDSLAAYASEVLGDAGAAGGVATSVSRLPVRPDDAERPRCGEHRRAAGRARATDPRRRGVETPGAAAATLLDLRRAPVGFQAAGGSVEIDYYVAGGRAVFQPRGAAARPRPGSVFVDETGRAMVACVAVERDVEPRGGS